MKAVSELKPEFKRFDFSKIDLLAVGEGGASVNINTIAGEVPMTEDSRRQMLQEVPKTFAQQGVKVEKLEARLETLGGVTKALILEYEAEIMGPMRQIQAYVPGGGKTAIVTCSAPKEIYASAEPKFRSVLASLRVPALKDSDSGGSRILSGALRGGIIGGLAGGLAVLLKLFKKKDKPAA